MNNNKFEWSRFCKVMRKDFCSIWPNFGSTMLVITLLPLTVWLLFIVFNMGDYRSMPSIAPELRWCWIICLAAFVAIMAPSRMYKSCNLPKKGIYFAMLPASKAEKFVSMLLFTIVVCPLLSLVGGIVFDCILTAIPFGPYSQWLFETGTWTEGMTLTQLLQSEEIHFSIGQIILIFLLTYLSETSTFFFTSTLFKKHKVLMTILCLWGLSFVSQLILTPIFVATAANESIPRWILRLGEMDSQYAANLIVTIPCVLNALWTLVFYWWSAHRLNKMAY